MQRWFFLEDERNDLLRHAKSTIDRAGPLEGLSLASAVQKQWLFKVRAPTLKQDEVVCVTGSTPELGNWVPEKCRVMEKVGGDVWSLHVNIPDDDRVYYRYCICVIVDPNVHVIVRSWEASRQPRTIKPVCPIPPPSSEPEIYGTYRGVTQIDKGWLTKGTIILLELSKDPFKLWRPRLQGRAIYIKITPVNLVKHYPAMSKSVVECLDESQSVDHLEDQPKFSYVEVSSLMSDDSFEFVPQGQFGQKFTTGDFVTFKIYLVNPATTAFLIDLYIYSSKAIDDEPPYHTGFTYLLPGAIEASKGSVVLPLTSMKQRPLGELRLRYVVIKPLPNIKCSMRETYEKYWNSRKRGLNIGHRGSGNSFKQETKDSADIRENTIASLKTAINSGADLVEFDVQLSKDLVPIIYHDFHVCIAMYEKKSIQESDMFELPLRDLTSEQLRMLRIYNVVEGRMKNRRFLNDDLEDHQPFPTLQTALETIGMQSGFNIEIKCPSKMLDGSEELPDTQDLNQFVDKILEVVLQYAGERKIVFSSFSPEAVAMVRLKQNKYPVMFLTQGDTKRYPQYDDPRCWNIQNGVNFAKMFELLGLSAHTEDILRDPALAQYGLSQGIIMFCWGDDLDDPNTISYLKNLGLHGIIYDKIYQYLGTEGKESIYLLDARESQKELIRRAATTTDIPQQSTYSFKKTKLDYDRDNISTATSLESLETEIDRVARVKGRRQM